MKAVIRAKMVESQIARRTPYGRRYSCKTTRRVLTPHEIELIIARRFAGDSLRVIAAAFKVTKQCIGRVCGRAQANSVALNDHQGNEQLAQREVEAKEAAKRFEIALANAKADGTRCSVKACVFPAVLNGECRSHAVDRHLQNSLMPSALPIMMDMAIGSVSRVLLPRFGR